MSKRLATLTLVALGLLAFSLISSLHAAPPADHSGHGSTVVAADQHAAAATSDEELIKKQKTCPVTDQPLGSMGKPVKVTVKGRTVFLCCAGCKKKLMADPDKYLKKLDEKK